MLRFLGQQQITDNFRSNTDSAGHRLGRRLRRFWFTLRKQL